MGIIVCRAPSKIHRLIRGGPISLVAIFLHLIDDDDLGSRNLSLEEDLLQLNWSAFTPPAHIPAAPLSHLLVSRFNIVQTDVKSVVAAASTPIPNQYVTHWSLLSCSANVVSHLTSIGTTMTTTTPPSNPLLRSVTSHIVFFPPLAWLGVHLPSTTAMLRRRSLIGDRS